MPAVVRAAGHRRAILPGRRPYEEISDENLSCLPSRLSCSCWLASFRPRTLSNARPASFVPAVPVPMGPSSLDHDGQRLLHRTRCA